MFYPDSMAYQEEELLHCMKNTVTASVIFAIVVGIPLLLLFVDCFVIMKGVVGFKVTILSILTAPASYPIVRTEILKEPKSGGYDACTIRNPDCGCRICGFVACYQW